MIGRLVRDESGIAMGLAVIVVVIVGVMGAGLLVFVRNDLEAAVQVNQGQEDFEAADAGIRAAERELLSNACPQATTVSKPKQRTLTIAAPALRNPNGHTRP